VSRRGDADGRSAEPRHKDNAMDRRPAPAILVLLVGLAMLALSACSNDEPDPATGQQAAQITTAAGSAGAGASGAVKPCTTADLKADLTKQDFGDVALLTLTNAAKQACTLNGWADVRVLDPTGGPVDIPTTKVDQPGPPVEVVLEPQHSAFAGIKWKACDKRSASCQAGNGIEVVPPGGAGYVDVDLVGFPEPEKVNLTMASIQIGSLQPATQGVVAW
jgi:hypothetical protein